MRVKSSNKVITFLVLINLLAGCATIPDSEIGKAIGAVAGRVIGSQAGGRRNEVWVAMGTLTAAIGNRIGKYLDVKDQHRMARASRNAVVSGEDQSWSNSENGASGKVLIVENTTRSRTVQVPVLKKRIAKVPPLKIIGETFKVKLNSNMRGGPGTDYEIVGALSLNEVVNVVGQVKGQKWYLVSHDGIGSGFVHANLLTLAADAELPESPKLSIAESDVIEMQVESERTCRKIEQSVSLADGTTKSEVIEACQGMNGWEAKV